MHRRPGIYQITIRGRIYVGCSVDLRELKLAHLGLLRRGKHPSKFMQAAYDKDREQRPKFAILEFVDDLSRLFEREQHWLDALQPFGRNGYNRSRIAGSTAGIFPSPETREKQSIAQRNRAPATAETRARLRAVRLGYKCAPETVAKIGAIRRGAKQPSNSHPEYRAKLSAALKGHVVTDLTRAKLKATLTGRVYSDETRRRMSMGQKRRFAAAKERHA
jgi:group I intron endonuclease